jgi:predicted DNA-binding transcriptional regulator YafY
VTKRTVERDLLDLSLAFPLVLDNRSKPYGWSWQKDAPAFSLPGLSNQEALIFMLVEQHLHQFMPASTQEVMAPYFKSARKTLDALPRSRRMGSWLNKVRSVPPSQPLLSPAIDPEVQNEVTEALLLDRQLAITYRSRSKDPSQYQVHPLALVQRGPITYLYVRFNDYQNTRTLAMHRIIRAEMLELDVEPPTAGFNLEDEVLKGRFGFGEGNDFQLVARFSNVAGEHLYETPLSRDQKIEALPDGLMVTATVADTPQVLWWILAMGAGVEVISPVGLRDKVAQTLAEASAAYKERS